MTDNNISITTNEFENKQKENIGNPSKIKLRPESFDNSLARIMSFLIKNRVFRFINLPNEVTKKSEAKPIMLNPEKFNNMDQAVVGLTSSINESAVEIENQDIMPNNETIVVTDMEQENQSEQSYEESSSLVQDEVSKSDDEVKNIIDMGKIDEAYAQISQETEETLKIKEAALKAQQDIQKVEETVMQEIEESNQRLQAKSVEQADMQAKKEETLKRKEVVEQQITEVFAQQRSALKKAKNNFLNVITLAEARQDDIRRQGKDQTEANESKIIQIQEIIDKDYNMITETEEEIARKENILKALSNTVELGIIDEVELVNFGFDNGTQPQEEIHKKVA